MLTYEDIIERVSILKARLGKRYTVDPRDAIEILEMISNLAEKTKPPTPPLDD